MNREEFKLRLAARLAALTDEERTEVFNYIDECLDEAIENGENENEALERLGDPDEASRQLLADRETKSAAPEQTAAFINSYDSAELRGVRIAAREAGINVTSMATGTVRVKYDVHKEEEFRVNIEDGVLVIKEWVPQRWMLWLKAIINLGWEGKRWIIELTLPKQFDGFIELESSNHSVSVEQINVSSLSARTSNGRIIVDGVKSAGELTVTSSNGTTSLRNSSAAGNVRVETSNGRAEAETVDCGGDMAVRTSNGRLTIESCNSVSINAKTSNGGASLTQVTAEKELAVKTSNGAIEVDAISAGKQIKLTSSNSSITGRLSGSASQYTIVTRTSNGKALPPSGGNGPTRLEATTSNGRIRLDFEKPYKLTFADD